MLYANRSALEAVLLNQATAFTNRFVGMLPKSWKENLPADSGNR